jgi:hypothetical protein
MPFLNENVSVYNYFLYDLISDTFLAEIPFKGVSYERAFKDAGSFSGSIPVIEETANLDIYNSTMPGKTALYVVRDNVCVWGGIIWSRSYDIISRNLTVDASEFTSYFHHRAIWQTWSSTYSVSITIQNGVGTGVLNDENYTFSANLPIYIDFNNENLINFSGLFEVSASPAPGLNTFTFDASQGTYDYDTQTWTAIPDVVDNNCFVDTRADTYHYMRQMLEEIAIDFSDIDFANIDIEPGIPIEGTAITARREFNSSTNQMEAIITVDSPHWAVPGQKVKVSNIGSGFDGYYIVARVPSSTSYALETTGSALSQINLTGNAVNVIKKKVVAATTEAGTATGIVTLTTASPHGFSANDVVTVTGVGDFVDGKYIIDSVTSTTITYTSLSSEIKETASIGTAEVLPLVIFNTYGSFTKNSDIKLGFSTNDYSGFSERTPVIRGYELKIVGEILDEYSGQLNGFDYRIDCTYSNVTNSFSKTLVFLPFKPATLTAYLATLPEGKLAVGDAAPPSAFGADKIVFEHPGNIITATMEESAEDSATRVWYTGSDSELTETQPYSAAAADDYLGGLTYPWPVLDVVQSAPNKDMSELELHNYAQQYLYDSLPPISTFNVSVNGSISPEIGTYAPGDWCSIRIDDVFVQERLDSNLESRNDVLVRKIYSYKVSVPDTPTFPERVDLQLITEAQVDKIGNSKTS